MVLTPNLGQWTVSSSTILDLLSSPPPPGSQSRVAVAWETPYCEERSPRFPVNGKRRRTGMAPSEKEITSPPK